MIIIVIPTYTLTCLHSGTSITVVIIVTFFDSSASDANNIHIMISAQPPPVTQAPPLPYVSLGSTDGVDREYVGHFDDGVSHAIHIPDGFPFGNLIHSSVYVSYTEVPYHTYHASANSSNICLLLCR